PEALSPRALSSMAVVHQATGMVVAQVGVHQDDAVALLRAQAFFQNTTLEDVATQVIQRSINFRDFTIEGD
ncbi:MAG: ANTAR domain-containing protein, partial [Aeromicrobium sp.]